MNHSDMPKFAQSLGVLAEVFGEQLSEVRVTAYAQVLSRFEIGQIECGIQGALSVCKYFPKPAELIELIEGSADDHSARAWQLLIEAVGLGGYYSSLFAEDFALAAAIRKTFDTGWMNLANEIPAPSDPTYASLYNRFRVNYGSARRSGEKVDRYFVGYYESQNRQNSSKWEQVGESESEPTFLLKVIVIAGGKCFEAKLPFSRVTGALTEAARKQLASGAVRPDVVSIPALPPARMIEGEADPAVVRQQIEALSGKRRLKLIQGGEAA